MPIVKITGQGLSAIALSVALLWGCLICQRVMLRHAYAERALVLRDLERMQRRQRSRPVSEPAKPGDRQRRFPRMEIRAA